jgi:hypothetical protein
MEVGSLREKIIIALLIYKFGETNIDTDIAITEPEIDVKVFGNPVSIKTISGRSLMGIKLIWTVDSTKAAEFLHRYQPVHDLILAHINWHGTGGLYYIPKTVQKDVFNSMTRTTYIKLPKPGTNPRGVEISKEACDLLIQHKDCSSIIIHWEKQVLLYKPYQHWVKQWEQNL